MSVAARSRAASSSCMNEMLALVLAQVHTSKRLVTWAEKQAIGLADLPKVFPMQMPVPTRAVE